MPDNNKKFRLFFSLDSSSIRNDDKPISDEEIKKAYSWIAENGYRGQLAEELENLSNIPESERNCSSRLIDKMIEITKTRMKCQLAGFDSWFAYTLRDRVSYTYSNHDEHYEKFNQALENACKHLESANKEKKILDGLKECNVG